MKSIPSKTVRTILTAVAIAFLSHCANREQEFSQNNPFDPGGINWKINIIPVITAGFGSTPLWYDYDFQKDAGTLRCSLSAYDKNGAYDTLWISALIGTSPDSLDTVFTKRGGTLDTILYVNNLKAAATYYYKFAAVDTWDSAAVASGSIATPAGRPPEQVDSIVATPSSSYVSLYWYGKTINTNYTMYRSPVKNSPSAPILDTTLSGLSASYYDYVPDYRMYYYVVASANGYGECRSKKEVVGYKYSTAISYPSYVSASDGDYSAYIYVYWYSVSYAVKYYIHRSRTSSGTYTIIDSTTKTSYNDTMRDTSTQFYYRISAANSSGQRSAPSTDYDLGYIAKLSSPNSVSASDGNYNTYIYITWYGVSGAAGYNTYRSLSSSGPFTLIGKAASTEHFDTVKTMDYYYYKVAAYDIFGREGNLSYSDAGYIYRTLVQPSSLTASQGAYDAYISVSWSAVTNATGYYMYRSMTSIPDSFSIIDTVSSTVYNDSVPLAENYYYAVAAFDSLGRTSQRSSSTYGYRARLATPYILTISKSSYYTHIALSWSTVTGASGYSIYRSDNGYAGPYTAIDSTTQTSYNDSSVTEGINYYYKISAYDTNGKQSLLSSYDYGSLAPFSYPMNIKASAFLYKNRIVLTWGRVPAATGYTVYRCETSSGSYIKLGTTTDTSYTDSISGNQNYYYYKLSSLKGATESPLSSYYTGYRLIPPSNFTVLGLSTYIRLAWSNGSYAGYYIYRSTDGIAFQRIAVLNGAPTSAYHDTVPIFQLYYYKISAFSTAEESDYSVTLSAQKLPAVPQNLTAGSFPTHVELRWSASTGANSYYIYRGSSTPANIWIGTTNNTAYNDSLSVATKYYYQVTAVNSGGESARSNYVYAGIIMKPSTPTNFFSVNSPLHISLSWTSNTAEQITGYYVYRADSASGTFTKIKTLTVKNCYDTVTNGQFYYYAVSAYNLAGESAPAPYITGQRLKPPAPASVSIQSEQFTTHLPVSWSSSVGAEGYNVYRSLSPDSGYAIIKTTASLSHNDSTVLSGTIYYYKISAYSIIGEGELSYYVSGKTLSQGLLPQKGILREERDK